MVADFETDAQRWAQDTYGGCTLPDKRLLGRLVDYAARQMADPKGSTARVCGTDRAAREAAYRFLENERVLPRDIDSGPIKETAKACSERERVLAIQDTTSVNVHSNLLREELINQGSPTGFLVHSTLMADARTGKVLGLAEQLRWLRQGAEKREGTSKESDKWKLGDLAMRVCLGKYGHVVTVADREADIYDFIQHHVQNGFRFVIRAKVNRRLSGEIAGLREAARNAPIIGTRKIRIEQRGAQPKRGIAAGRAGRRRHDVVTQLGATKLALRAPRPGLPSLDINVVHVQSLETGDQGAESGSLEWMLLTSEPIETLQQVEQIVSDYENRWVIEEFHKCWKTGCRLESRPFESFGAVERMMAVTAPMAVRILRLHTAARSEVVSKDVSVALSDTEARCLWAATEKGKAFPDQPLTARWGLFAIATLGGWYDSKKTGTVGWSTLWHGWNRFQERLAGWVDAQAAVQGLEM